MSDAQSERPGPPPGVGARLAEHVARGVPSFSFEVFPPKTEEGQRHTWEAIRELEALGPSFMSVTYGAGGSTRDRTTQLVSRVASQTSILPVAHLTCVGATAWELRQVVQDYLDAGVHHVLALRGDPKGGPGTTWTPYPGGFNHCDALVAMLAHLGSVRIGVAAFPEGHPESRSLDDDAKVLARKQHLGAEFAITQFFFRSADYRELVERSRDRGCTMPILPGIIPVENLAQIERFATLSGAAFPEELAARFRALGDDEEAVRKLGVLIATELCEELLDYGVPGLHFYTLNRADSTHEIYDNLGLGRHR